MREKKPTARQMENAAAATRRQAAARSTVALLAERMIGVGGSETREQAVEKILRVNPNLARYYTEDDSADS